ncbi:MAG: HEPN domain-containing protein [Desulfotomaculaceae bacterium]|nr:HEPN domain-containing protein [Desulfotomaculaceae bacterium]
MAGGVTKQITWTYAREGCPTNARISLCNKKYLHCLFFCQQAIEKAVKAVYYDKYNKTPPRKHDLVALAKNAGIFSVIRPVRESQPGHTLSGEND